MSFLIGTNSIPFSIICRSFDEVILRKKEKEAIHVVETFSGAFVATPGKHLRKANASQGKTAKEGVRRRGG
jgi:hypothetical protein